MKITMFDKVGAYFVRRSGLACLIGLHHMGHSSDTQPASGTASSETLECTALPVKPCRDRCQCHYLSANPFKTLQKT